jgi:hypothetical protein
MGDGQRDGGGEDGEREVGLGFQGAQPWDGSRGRGGEG